MRTIAYIAIFMFIFSFLAPSKIQGQETNYRSAAFLYGVKSLAINGDTVTVTAIKADCFTMKNAKGNKNDKLNLKAGDSFSVELTAASHLYKLDKIEAPYIFFSKTVKNEKQEKSKNKDEEIDNSAASIKIMATPLKRIDKYECDPELAAYFTRINGIGGMSIDGDTVIIKLDKSSGKELRNFQGRKDDTIKVKVGEEFFLISDIDKTSIILRAVNDKYAEFVLNRKISKQTYFAEKGVEYIYPFKLQAF